jgi:hypothetical protein
MSEIQLAATFQVGYVVEFGEHSTKHQHTKFQTQILMYGKAAALGSLLHIHCYKLANRQPSLVLLHKQFGRY